MKTKYRFKRGQAVLLRCVLKKSIPVSQETFSVKAGSSIIQMPINDIRPCVTRKKLAKFWDNADFHEIAWDSKSSRTFEDLCKILGIE